MATWSPRLVCLHMVYGVVSLVVKPRVVIPLSRVRFSYDSPNYADVAQLVEQRIENPCVSGSIPLFGTKIIPM